ncbi:MAG: anthranilate synthase component I [Actinobacteria bacterium]|nr:anthranilate synthase component I [Actinomycetota bacterium]
MTDVYERVAPDGRIVPSPEEFEALADDGRRVIPVVRKLLADGMTPISVYRALADERPGTFLLESAEQGGRWTRFSFIGVRSAAYLTETDGEARWRGRIPVGLTPAGLPQDLLAEALEVLATPRAPGLPPLTSGLVGALGYDIVRRWERVPDANPDEVGLPELAMLLATDLAVFDHREGAVWLIANAINFDDRPTGAAAAYSDAVLRLEQMTSDLCRGSVVGINTLDGDVRVHFDSRTAAADYLAGVERAKEHIRAGDAFQIVVSQRFSMSCAASALDVYRVLRATNPSPYMYLFRMPAADDLDAVAFDIVGSSPEALVTLKSGEAMLHPIAGTRPRGASEESDGRLAEELLADAKERAEHLMLVDLGRNDLGRVCTAGSVEVVEFMAVERFSHVMHIVSTVIGQLEPRLSAVDLLAATFPAGTLSGAPKPRAMEIIDDLEPVRRGLYAGCVGYLDFAGDADTAITIRTAVIAGQVAYVQAGAGIVADSDPQAEHAECRSKAMAVLRSIALAGSLRSPR